ncbi:MAG: cytochrome c [Planctomycetota bacterium]|nr:MAG: cytochrome c [Planctomycetota bacterium]
MKALDGLGLAVVAALTVTGIVLMSPGRAEARTPDVRYTLDPVTRKDYAGFGEEGFAALEQALTAFFGPHAQPTLPDGAAEALGLSPERIQHGRNLYVEKCMHCHGMSGGGDGPTAPFLVPRPRSFRMGKIKFASTPRTSPPVHEDLLRVLQRGVAYTAMPSFVNESREDLEALASYAQFLLMRGSTERLVAFVLDDEGTLEEELTPEQRQQAILEYMAEEFDGVRQSWVDARDQVIEAPTPRPQASEESVARGKALFLDATTECSACHGEDGKGQGPNVYSAEPFPDEITGELRTGYKKYDEWGTELKAAERGYEARPADLTRGFYRGGDRPIDLYRRIHQGVNGNIMPAFGGNLTPEQIWDLVNYIYSIRFLGVR